VHGREINLKACALANLTHRLSAVAYLEIEPRLMPTICQRTLCCATLWSIVCRVGR